MEHRLELWHRGYIDALVKEGKCIQYHLQSTIHSGPQSNNVARKFDQLMTMSKVTTAFKLLSADTKGILPLNSKIPCRQDGDGDAAWKSVRDILAEKHPPGRAAVSDSLLESDSINAPCYDPVLFEQLTGDLIRWAALRTHGATTPSNVDAYTWRQLCFSFGSASVTLCNGLAAVAHCICIDDVDSAELMAFVACRLFLRTRNQVFNLSAMVMFLNG